MAQQHSIDVSEVVEHQGLSKFLVRLVLISWVVTFLDAFDMNVVAFAGPYIAPYFHLSKVMMGNVFGFGLFGQVFGALIFGYIGDIIGRRRAILLASTWFAVSTFLVALAHGYGFLLTARFLQGIGVGGFLPLIWALNIEYAPKRYRSTLVILNTVGYSTGVIMGGPIALSLIPKFGWQSVFLIGGGVDLLATVVLAAMLPESIRFLVSKRLRPDVVAKIVERIVPGRTTPETQFVLSDEGGQGRKFTPKLLFVGALRWITPLLWISYFCCKLTTFFVTTWTPMFFQAMQFAPSGAAWAVTVSQLGGLLVALMLMRFIDNYGAIAITLMPLLEIPLMLIAGLFAFGHAAFFVLYALLVTFQLSGQQGMNGIIGVYYPSSYRSNGTAWASAIANVGAALGPIVGGFILASSHLQTRNVLAVLAVFPAIVAVILLIMGRMHTRILGREALEAPTEQTFPQVSVAK